MTKTPAIPTPFRSANARAPRRRSSWLAALGPAALLALSAGATGCGGSDDDAEIGTGVGRPVVLDTDMAGQDWIALLYLLNRPDVDLVALTVPGTGTAECDTAAGRPTGAKNALRIAHLSGKVSDKRAAACGRTTPLLGTGAFPAAWRSDAGTFSGLSVPPSPLEPDKRSAVEVLTQVLEKSKKPVTIVATGPLTDIAEVISARGDLVKNVDSIWITAGAVAVKGDLTAAGSPVMDNTSAEWNAFVDPRALRIVLKSGAKVKMVPLDGTNRAQVTRQFRDQLGMDRGTASAELAYQYFQKQSAQITAGNLYFRDPLTAAAMTDPAICKWNYDQLTGTTKEYRIAVTEDEGNELGRTIQSEDGYLVDVCTDADGVRFEQLFLDVMNQRLLPEEPGGE